MHYPLVVTGEVQVKNSWTPRIIKRLVATPRLTSSRPLSIARSARNRGISTAPILCLNKAMSR